MLYYFTNVWERLIMIVSFLDKYQLGRRSIMKEKRRYVSPLLFGGFMAKNHIGKISGYDWFLKKFGITKLYTSTVLHTGKEIALSTDKIRNECTPIIKNSAYEILFQHPLILRNSDIKLSYLTLHCDVDSRTVFNLINEWEDFKYYLHKYNLIATIYEDPKYAFLTKSAKTLVVINRKTDDDIIYLYNEIIRYIIDPKDTYMERYVLTFKLENASMGPRMICDQTFIPLTVVPERFQSFTERIAKMQ